MANYTLEHSLAASDVAIRHSVGAQLHKEVINSGELLDLLHMFNEVDFEDVDNQVFLEYTETKSRVNNTQVAHIPNLGEKSPNPLT